MKTIINPTALAVVLIFGAGCSHDGPSVAKSSVTQVEWAYFGGTPWNERHATLANIDKDTVASLVPRRVFQLGAIGKGGSFSSSPLVIGGVLYVSASDGLVQAFDIRTGGRKWSFQHKLDLSVYEPSEKPGSIGLRAPACCSNTSRGLAYADGMLFIGTLDAKVIAIDASTGNKKWEVWAVKPEDNPDGIYGYNSAPVVVEDLVVIGTTGGEAPSRHHLTAFDRTTGKQVWRWYTIPAPDGSDPVAPDGWWGEFVKLSSYGQEMSHRDVAQEKTDKEKYKESWRIGGGALWMPVTYDSELGLIFVGTGNANPDLDGRGRPGDNLYTNSVVAIDAETGKTRWYFQIEPHGLWDRDETTPPVVTMLEGRKVVVHAGKIGWMFVLDAATGEFIRKSDMLVPSKNMWVAPSETPVTVLPGASGGNNWSPISVDRHRRLGFVGAMSLPVEYTIGEEDETAEILGRSSATRSLGGSWSFDMGSAAGILSAVDLSTGKIKWQYKRPYPFVGGVFSTSTGLVFLGESDGHLTAFDSDTGEVMWQFNTGAGVNAPPISFTLDGEEFIAVASGGSDIWGSPRGDAVFVFGLPKKWEAAK
jgi:PQQ-dependent dehydrogenase (methanol/ethanol family)